MFILDRYLLRQFVQIFLICFASLMGLYVVIDAFGHLDHFSASADAGGGLMWVIARYYAYRSLAFFDQTSGILALIAAMFTVAWLQRYQELTAIMAAGISKFRIIRPLLLATAAVSLLGVIDREVVIPRCREEVGRNTKDLGLVSARDLEPRFDSRTDILIGGEKIVLAERRIIKPAFVLPATLSKYGKQLAARDGRAVDADGDHPAGFILSSMTAPDHIGEQPSMLVDGQPVIVTPHDAPWLAPNEVFVVSDLPFTLLAGGSSWRQYASSRELVAQLNERAADLGPEVRVAVHARAVRPLMDGTLLMLGLPLVLSRRQRNVFLTIGVCVGVAAAFTLAGLACQSLGGLGVMRPQLAAWLPLLVFVPLAAAMSQNLRT